MQKNLVILCYSPVAVSTGKNVLSFEEEREIVQIKNLQIRNCADKI